MRTMWTKQGTALYALAMAQQPLVSASRLCLTLQQYFSGTNCSTRCFRSKIRPFSCKIGPFQMLTESQDRYEEDVVSTVNSTEWPDRR